VGIGSATPGTSLDVTLATASATVGNIRIAPNSAGQARYHLFNGGGIAEWLFGQKTGSSHNFILSKSVAGSESDYLTVDTNGRVGIGTLSPASLLHVLENGNAQINISATDAGSNSAGISIENQGQRNWQIWADRATDQFRIGNNSRGSTNLAINSSGNLGLGTTTPSAKLHVSGNLIADSSAGECVFTSDSNWNYGNLYLKRNASNISTAKMLSMILQGDNNADTTLTNHLNIWGTYSAAPTTGSTTAGLSGVMNLGAPYGIALHVNNSPRLLIDSSGSVGIGNSSPSYRLDITSADTTAGVGYAARLRANATAGAAALQFTDNSASTQYGYIACDSSLNLKFASGNNERFCITSAGFLGHNTTSPAAPAHFALPTTNATIGNVYVAPSIAGQARFHLYNGGAQAEWIFGQRTSTDHEFRIGTQVAGVETERLRIGTGGQIGIGGANYGTSGQVLTSNGSGSAPSWTTVTALTAGTAVSATGIAVDFTGIPSSAKRITVMIDAVSTDASATLAVQLGDSGGIETSGYTGGLAWTGPNTGSSGSASAFPVAVDTGSTHSGHAVITKVSGNTWVLSSTVASESDDRVYISGGSKGLSATLDRIRITTTGGTASFDGGTVNILYE
jgi:hypothetical protein